MLQGTYQSHYNALVASFESGRMSERKFSKELSKLNDESFNDARVEGTLKDFCYSGIENDMVVIPVCRI